MQPVKALLISTLLLLAGACAPSAEAVQTAIAQTQSAQPTETAVPVVPTLTSTPEGNVIAPENAAKVTLFARIGEGSLEGNPKWSADGRTLAFGGSIGIHIYDVETLEQRKFIETGRQTHIGLSPDGTIIAANGARSDREIDLWDAASGKPMRTLGHSSGAQEVSLRRAGPGAGAPGGGDQPFRISTLVFSPDNRTLAAYDGKNLIVWNAFNGDKLYSFEVPGLESLVFSQDGKILAVGSDHYGETIRLWALADGRLVSNIKVSAVAHPFPASFRIALSPDGRTIVSANKNQTVTLWNTSGKLLLTLDTHWHASDIAFSPDGSTVVSTSPGFTLASGGMTRIWDSASGRPLQTTTNKPWVASNLILSRDARSLAFIGQGYIQVWGVSGDRPVHAGLAGMPAMLPLAFSPDGHSLAFRAADAPRLDPLSAPVTINTWHITGSRLVQQTEMQDAHPPLTYAAAFSPDLKTVAVADDGNTYLWDVANGKLLHSWPASNPSVSLAFSPDGRMLANPEGGVSLWDTGSGQLVQRFEPSELGALAFSPDGQTLAAAEVAGGSNTIKLYDAAGGRLLQTLPVSPSAYPVFGLTFSPRGHLLAYITDTGIKVWDVESNTLLRTIENQCCETDLLAFSPDGRLLAQARLNSILLWDATTGEPLKSLEGHAGEITMMAFSPDGDMLASVSKDGTVRVWGVQ